MADDKKELSLNPSARGSSVPMTGGEEFSLQPCTQAKSMGFSLEPCTQAAEEACTGDQGAHKRKAPTSGLDGCAPKRTGEEVSEEVPWQAVDWLLEEEDDDLDYDEEFIEKIKARYAADVQKLFGSNPNVVWVDFPPCCVRPPGVVFPMPGNHRPDGQNDAAKEDEEFGGAVDDVVTPPASA